MTCSLDLWQAMGLQMPYLLLGNYRKNIYQRRRTYGWLLWTWRRLLTGSRERWCGGLCGSWGVDEWIVSVIKSMYEDATTAVKVNGRVSNAFVVRVGVHQGSVLSPLLFIIVLKALSREFREGLPMELLYADDLVLLADSMEE